MPSDYLMTMDVAEASNAIKTLGYANEQVVCWMYTEQADNTTPFFRLIGPGGHFYTASEAEEQSLIEDGA
ncbi:MAG TPA: hypothetical protein VIT91_12120 [Chthoniobacterales bacterium]